MQGGGWQQAVWRGAQRTGVHPQHSSVWLRPQHASYAAQAHAVVATQQQRKVALQQSTLCGSSNALGLLRKELAVPDAASGSGQCLWVGSTAHIPSVSHPVAQLGQLSLQAHCTQSLRAKRHARVRLPSTQWRTQHLNNWLQGQGGKEPEHVAAVALCKWVLR